MTKKTPSAATSGFAADRFQLRIPQELREALEAACEKSRRSLNSEIAFRLHRDLSNEGKAPLVLQEKPPIYKSDRLDQHLVEVVKNLPPDKQLALLQLLK